MSNIMRSNVHYFRDNWESQVWDGSKPVVTKIALQNVPEAISVKTQEYPKKLLPPYETPSEQAKFGVDPNYN